MIRNSNKSVDDYIKSFPENIRINLQKIRKTIKEIAPDAEEKIGYGIPTFKLNEKNLVHFAAYKNHIGFYPSPSGINAYEKELAKYRSGKGTIQFPLSSPIPYDLIKKIVSLRVKENLNKHK